MRMGYDFTDDIRGRMTDLYDLMQVLAIFMRIYIWGLCQTAQGLGGSQLTAVLYASSMIWSICQSPFMQYITQWMSLQQMIGPKWQSNQGRLHAAHG